MNYNIFGNNLPGVDITLEPGESIYTESGAMAWMSTEIKMETNMRGGLGKSFGRIFTGESMFMVTYTAQAPNQCITMTSSFPGEIHCVDVGMKQYICQKNSFLCAQTTVQLSVHTNGVKAGLFGGEGFFLQRLSGQGKAFLELDGAVRGIHLEPGQKIIVDSGNIAYFESSVQYSAQVVKGVKNVLFGGEGLFLSTLEGPGDVFLQTLTAREMAGRIAVYIPSKG